jgi:hypothetical protein
MAVGGEQGACFCRVLVITICVRRCSSLQALRREFPESERLQQRREQASTNVQEQSYVQHRAS